LLADENACGVVAQGSMTVVGKVALAFRRTVGERADSPSSFRVFA
jgi:hypothetical protein